MRPVGYILHCPDGPQGERGQFYTYVLAGNGLCIEAEGPLLSARIPIMACEVRGLAPLESRVALTYGSIPQRFWDLALSAFMADPDQERYVAVIVDGGYNFYIPAQERRSASVTYDAAANVVLDLHSHGKMRAFFSGQDDKDEQGLRLYGVVGTVRTDPVVKFRVGVYGYFMEVNWRDIFSGTIAGALEFYGEEVEKLDGIRGDPEAHGEQLEYLSRWLRWDWWLRG